MARGRAAHDRVVNNQHVFVLEFGPQRVQLVAYKRAPFFLPRHDERPADVAVFDKTLAVRHFEVRGQFQRRGAAGVGHRNHDVNVVVAPFARNLAGETRPHPHPRLMHEHAVNDRVGTGEIDVFKYAAGLLRLPAAHLVVHPAFGVNENRLTRLQIPDHFKPEHIQRHAFGRANMFQAASGFLDAVDQRADAVRVAKSKQAKAGQQGRHRIRTAAAVVQPPHRRKYIRRLYRHRVLFQQLVGQDV